MVLLEIIVTIKKDGDVVHEKELKIEDGEELVYDLACTAMSKMAQGCDDALKRL